MQENDAEIQEWFGQMGQLIAYEADISLHELFAGEIAAAA